MVLQNIKLGAESVLMRPAPSILDTGTSMIVGPFEDVGLIAETIGAECVVFTDPSSTSVYDVGMRFAFPPAAHFPLAAPALPCVAARRANDCNLDGSMVFTGGGAAS